MYKDKKIFILGMARSGYEVAKLLAPDNKILITDVKPQDNDKVKELEGIGVEFILSDKPDDFFDDSYDSMIISVLLRLKIWVYLLLMKLKLFIII